jgi:hypothetical protein
MKTCPHCGITYTDDNLFCFADGNALVNEDGEQPTLLNQKFSMNPVEEAEGGKSAVCAKCGTANNADSIFCKGCGAGIFGAGASGAPGHPHPEIVTQARLSDGPAPPFPTPEYGDTVAFQPQVFTPPTDTGSRPRVSNNNGIIVALAGACVVLVVTLFALFGWGGGSGPGTNKNASPTPVPKPTLEKSFDYVYSGNYVVTGISLTMTLKRSGDSLTGTASTPTKTDTVEGKIDDNGAFKLSGWENGTRYTGIYSGNISADGKITGQWTKTDGSAATAFSLSR